MNEDEGVGGMPDDGSLLPAPDSKPDKLLRDLVELTPERQVAAAALGRAKDNARRRGFKPGDAARSAKPLEVRLGGAHPGGRDPALVADTMSSLFTQFGWTSDLAGGTIQARWADIVGPLLANHVSYVSFESGRLVVQTDSTARATELQLTLPSFLAACARELGEGVVVAVEVMGPGGHTFAKGRRSVRGRGVRDTFG